MPNELKEAIAEFLATLSEHPDQDKAIKALLTVVIVGLEGNSPRGIINFLSSAAHHLGVGRQQPRDPEAGFDLSRWDLGNREPN
jgi:hypothetical protein